MTEAPARLRQLTGGVLLLFAVLPLWDLLATPTTGPAGAVTLALTREAVEYQGSAALLLLALALLAAMLLPEAAAVTAGARVRAALLAPRTSLFAAGCAVLALLVTLYVNQRVLRGEPTLIDAMSQLLHARYLAAGRLAGQVGELGAFWHTQQTLNTAAGWVSQYPPGHVAVLALGMVLGAVQWTGAVVLGLAVFVAGLLAHRLLPHAPVAARAGTLLLAASPFAIAHAAAYMNHTTAALFALLALYATLRVLDGGASSWAVLAGAALGALFATRPLTGVVVGAVAGLALLGAFGHARPRARRLLLVAGGALPLVLLLALYNQHFFGAPHRFGYTVALGPDGGLGFGTDPWGNLYDLRAALGYTAAELGALNLYLLESPLPVVVLTGLFLLLARRLEPGERLLVAWALLPLVAHLFYWHHGLHMGPRMLNEYAPAWCLLTALAAVRLLAFAPAALPPLRRLSPRRFAGAALLGAWVFALFVGAPTRLSAYRQSTMPIEELGSRVEPPALVFVHGTWGARVAMQLAAQGMRLDSLEAVVQANSTCELQRFLDGEPLRLQLAPVARNLARRELPGGSRIVVRAGEPWPATCAQQAAADRFGVVEVTAFLWRSGLPGIRDDRALLARDLGPEQNERLIAATGRHPWLFHVDTRNGRFQLLPYRDVIDRMWEP